MSNIKPLKSLVVDDEASCLYISQTVLEFYGEVQTAGNGEEALALFKAAIAQKKPFDVCLLDIMMPQMDGQTVLKEMRRLEKENGIKPLEGIKVIMISALSDKRNILEAYGGNCEAYIIKPFEPSVISKRLLAMGLIKTISPPLE